jgi:hypothetical protein
MKIGTPGVKDSKGKTIDTIPPRINYALTLPERGEIFVQFSEPIDITKIQFVVDGNPLLSSQVKPVDAEGREYLLPSSSYKLEELASGAKEFSVKDAVDKALRAFDENYSDPVNPQYPSPNYPSDWKYTSYVMVRYNSHPPGVLIPGDRIDPKDINGNRKDGAGNKLIGKADLTKPDNPYSPPSEVSHRVTDVLVSQPPTRASEPTWFIWPVWAKDNPTVVSIDAGNFSSLGLSDFPSTGLDDFGLIWEFTGKGLTGKNILQRRDITMQVRRNNALTNPAPSNKPVLYYRNVADTDKAGEKHGPRELWLPPFSMLDFSNIVPLPLNSSTSTADKITDDVFNFKLLKQNYENRKMLEFVFGMEGYPAVPGAPLYAARLDIGKGAAVPSNWYRLIKPFRIDIHDTIQQRSGVTILNNVIDPTKGEKTYLNYMTTRSGRVTIQIFTMDGSLVKVLRRENRSAGEYRETWDGTNRGGRAVARGMYFIRVVAPDIDEIRKVLIVK